MAQYRISRNFEASLIDYIKDELNSASFNINVEKSFARVYELNIPVICVRTSDTDHNKIEIGSNSTIRIPTVLIDIFAQSDGQRLDLKDFLIEILRNGLPYYEYTISNGTVQNKTQNGRIHTDTIIDTIVNLGVDKSSLAVHDRYRHLLTLEMTLNRVEA